MIPPGVRMRPGPFQLAEWQAISWAPGEGADSGGRYRRWLQQQLHQQPQRTQELARHSHLQEQLLDLLSSLSRGLACREPVETVLSETLRGVLDLAGISQGGLLVRLEPGGAPLTISRGF